VEYDFASLCEWFRTFRMILLTSCSKVKLSKTLKHEDIMILRNAKNCASNGRERYARRRVFSFI